MSDTTRNIFVSHVHEDDAGLADLKQLLERHGMAVRDYSIRSDNPNNAHAEDYIKYEILAPRIRQCSALVVYVSPDTRWSDWVNWEIEYAHRLGKRIVGAYEMGAAGCELPEALEAFRDALVGWRGEDIIGAVEGDVNTSRGPEGETPSTRDICRHDCG